MTVDAFFPSKALAEAGRAELSAWRNLQAHERRCHDCGHGGLCPLGRVVQHGWYELHEFARAMRWLLRRAPATNAFEQQSDRGIQEQLERAATEVC